MRVAVVTAFPRDPAAPHGGVEAVSVNLVRALAWFEDLDLHVVTTDPGSSEVVRATWNGATVHRLPRPPGRTLTTALGPGRRLIREYLRDLGPDVVHAHDTYGLMAQGFPAPRVLTIHGFIHGDTAVSGERWAGVRSRLWRSAERRAWADYPHIISISPYVRERLSGIARGVIHDIDNPVAERFFEVERREGRPTVFSAAVISPRKNTLALLEAFAGVLARGVDAELRLAGAIVEPAYGAAVERRLRQPDLDGRVKLLGRIGTAAVCAELAAASVFALVSLEENSPLAIEEAMAAGVPVVTSNRCGMPYMVRDGESGFLVDPTDPGDIAARLGRLLEDDDLRARLGDRSREIARDRFHPGRVAARTREVYLRAAAGLPGGRAAAGGPAAGRLTGGR